jgi:ribose transport system substrate-binding protein
MKNIALTLLLLLTACGPLTAQVPKPLVIFSQCNSAEPYRAAQNASFRQLWSQASVTFEILDAGQDNARQVAQIDAAILRHPSLLIVAPNERVPLSDVLGRAMAAGIRVICLERDIENAQNYTTWIRSDNYTIGMLVGLYIVDFLKAKYGEARGRVVDIHGLEGVEGEVNRERGAYDVLGRYPGIIKVQEAFAGWLQKAAEIKMAGILKVESKIDVVYGHNDPMAMGAYDAALAVHREKEMIFVGVDGLNGPGGGIEQVKNGKLYATFIYPLCTDEAYAIGLKLLADPKFVPEKQYMVKSSIVLPETARRIYVGE